MSNAAALRADLDRARLALADELGRTLATVLAGEAARETDPAVRFTFEAVPNNLGVVRPRLVAAETRSGRPLDRDALHPVRFAAWDHETLADDWFGHLQPAAGDTVVIEAPVEKAPTVTQMARRLADVAADADMGHVDDARAFVDAVAVTLEPFVPSVAAISHATLDVLADTLHAAGRTDAPLAGVVHALLVRLPSPSDRDLSAAAMLRDALRSEGVTTDEDDDAELDDAIDDEPVWCIDCAEDEVVHDGTARCRACDVAYRIGTCPPDLDRISVSNAPAGADTLGWDVIDTHTQATANGWEAARTTFLGASSELEGSDHGDWWRQTRQWVADLEQPYTIAIDGPDGHRWMLRMALGPMGHTIKAAVPPAAAPAAAAHGPKLDGTMRRRAIRAIGHVAGVKPNRAANILDGADTAIGADTRYVRDAYLTGAATAAAVSALADALGVGVRASSVSTATLDRVTLRAEHGSRLVAHQGRWDVVEVDHGKPVGAGEVPTGLRADHHDPLTVARALLAILDG